MACCSPASCGRINWRAVKIVPLLFLQTCYVLGTVKSIGVFMPSLQASLGISVGDVGLALAFFNVFAFGPGPLVTYFYKWRGGILKRPLLISGSIMAPCGLMAVALARNNVQLTAALSIGGLGSNIMSLCTIIALAEQAGSQFRGLYGIGKSGYAFGMAIVPLFSHFLLMQFGWRGSALIVGGIMCHLIPLSMLVDMRPMIKDPPIDPPSVHGEEDTGEKLLQLQVTEDDQSSGNLSTRDEVEEAEESSETMLKGRDLSNAEMSESKSDNKEESAEKLLELKVENDEKSSGYNSSHKDADTESEASDLRSRDRNCLGKLVEALRKSSFNRDRMIIVIQFGIAVLAMVDGAWHAFLIPRAVGRDVSTYQALILVYSSASAAFIGRCLGGFIFNPKVCSYQSWFLILTLVNGTALAMDSVLHNFVLMTVTAFLSSLSIAERNILSVILFRERVSLKEFPTVLAISEIFFGVGAFIGTSLTGLFVHRTGNYAAAFLLLASLDFLLFLIMLPPKFFKPRPQVSAELNEA